jgi:hypothetical protein
VVTSPGRRGAEAELRHAGRISDPLQVLTLIVQRAPAELRGRFCEELRSQSRPGLGELGVARSPGRPDLYARTFATMVLPQLSRSENVLARAAIGTLTARAGWRGGRLGAGWGYHSQKDASGQV